MKWRFLLVVHKSEYVVEALQTVMWPQLCHSSSSNNEPSEKKGQIPNEKDVEDFEILFAALVHFKETLDG